MTEEGKKTVGGALWPTDSRKVTTSRGHPGAVVSGFMRQPIPGVAAGGGAGTFPGARPRRGQQGPTIRRGVFHGPSKSPPRPFRRSLTGTSIPRETAAPVRTGTGGQANG